MKIIVCWTSAINKKGLIVTSTLPLIHTFNCGYRLCLTEQCRSAVAYVKH